ncbi:hypothetical protein PV379_11685, partial [Streptomyces caniscabiei]|uniref:hypothetical protein n=1 Tax=Streptomyces caniscabiei TaxID=2746961 RepID=UPI0029AA2766
LAPRPARLPAHGPVVDYGSGRHPVIGFGNGDSPIIGFGNEDSPIIGFTTRRAPAIGATTRRNPTVGLTPRPLPPPLQRRSMPQLPWFPSHFGKQRLRAQAECLRRGLVAAGGSASRSPWLVVVVVPGAPVGGGTPAGAARDRRRT